MKDVNLDMWWASLTITQKERVALKGLGRGKKDADIDPALYQYPGCTAWWMSLDENRKTWIHEHCEKSHGYIMQEWNEADPYGD